MRKPNAFRLSIALLFFLIGCLLFNGTKQLSAQDKVNIYGYFSVNYENVGKEPDGNNSPGEFSFPHLNVMMQSRLSDQFRMYINLAGDGGGTLAVRNYWGEYVWRDYLKFRAGKIYRPFGLFNEKLDAVPTYLGIEPPELFDNDHLMLPRTGEVMVHGNIPMNDNTLKYAVMIGNKEVIDEGKAFSWDLNLSHSNKLIIGTSGYHSDESGAPQSIGEGSPSGGVLPWMARDKYTVLGGYFQGKVSNLTVKAAYWAANHDAVRDAASIVSLDQITGLNAIQRNRFGLTKYDQSSDINDIVTNVSYSVKTYYIRLGYTIAGGTIPAIKWETTPFIFWDFYENPETIAKKTYGGDNEAGLADDGKFAKPTIGIAIKPIYNVALKIDASTHMYKWNGDDVSYKEIRFDLSYFFK
ncbi:hypothetical protein JW960_03975 [candidate division KSB1 bacterium]|nr:hypothetical protein [candidate division KSB1 bacterium]